MLRISAAFEDGTALPAAALVRVNGVDAGVTDASGSAVVTWPEGPVEVAVILPSLARGETSATVVAAQTTEVPVALVDGQGGYEPSTLTVDELANGGLDLATPSLTLRYRRPSDGAAVPVASVRRVTLATPADAEQDLTALFRVAPDGAVAATNVSAVSGALAATYASTVTLRAEAVDTAGLSYLEAVTFTRGLHGVTVALSAPPSRPDLPIANVPVAMRFGTVDTTMTSDANGRLTLDRVPDGPVSLSAATSVRGSWFNGAADFSATGDHELTMTLRGTADVLAGVRPWTLTTPGGAAVRAPASPTLPASRAAGSPAGSTSSHVSPAPEAPVETADIIGPAAYANVDGGPADVPQVKSAAVTVAKGSTDIVLAYSVRSGKYPTDVMYQSPYDDAWGVTVLGPAGQVLFSVNRSVNSQLHDPPAFRYDPFLGGITGNIFQELGVSALAADSDVVLTLVATVTSVGAPYGMRYGTEIDSSLGAFQPRLSVTAIRKDRVSQPPAGRSDRFSIPRPGAQNSLQRTLDVDFTKAANVTVTRAKVDLMNTNNVVLQTVTDAAVGEPGVTTVDANTLRVRATYGGTVQSNVVSTPPPTDGIRYRVTLTGRRADGTTVVSSAQQSTEFSALWRMPDGFPRYSTRDAGGDDWASRSTYNWLSSNQGLVTRINDISGEHARNIGHRTHLEGRDIDLYHVYNFPNNPHFNGTLNFYRLAEDTQAAMLGNAEARARVAEWASRTRTRFSALITNEDTERIYYAIGAPIAGGSSTPGLQRGWARALLEGGSYTNAAGQSVNLGVGGWANADDPKMVYNEVHDNHFHLTLAA